MTEETPSSFTLDKTLYFTSLKNSSFDYSLPIKKNLSKFSGEYRIEASPYLFEYLCYKICQKKLEKIKSINPEISIISEKYLSSEISNKSDAIRKKYVFVPIRNSISRKWNAVIFIHLEKQINQYMKQINEEPIIAKIISSNINSEEDDYILNTTMDRIESTFNFSSPEDIQFEVDSINISDQPNTSIFLLNFIEGLIEQKSDEDIMNYIMKLYDESSNTNAIGSNNYFISFNKENKLFKAILPIYEKELEEYLRTKGENNKENEDKNLLKMEENEDDIDSEEEALKIIAKENEEIRKQMEEQEIVFNMKINDPNYRLENDDINYKNRNNILGQIQEVDDESDDESDKKSNIISKSLKLSKSLKKSENNLFNDEKIKNSVKEKLVDLNEFDNIQIKEISNINENELHNEILENKEHHLNKEESIEITNNNIFENIKNNDIKNEDKEVEKMEEKEENYMKSEESDENKEENIIIVKSNNSEINKINDEKIINKNQEENKENDKLKISREIENKKPNLIENNQKEIFKENDPPDKEEINNREIQINKKENEINNNIKNNVESIENQKEKEKENISMNILDKNENNSFEQINMPKFQNKTIEISSSDIKIKSNNIKDMHNSIRDSLSSSNTNNSVYEKKKVFQKRNSFGKNSNYNINEDINVNKYNNTNFYISNGISKDNKEKSNDNNNQNTNEKKENENLENINKNVINNDSKNIIFNKKNGVGKYKTNLPLIKKNSKTKSNIVNNDKKNNNIYNEGNIDIGKFEKNTIIINESTNNKTVINIIGIKNNYKQDDTKAQVAKNKKYENKNDKNIINNQNQIWNINISNHNKINLINNENEDNEYITKIPDDGTINRVSSTLCANNTITDIKNHQEKTYRTISDLNNIKNNERTKTEPNEIVNKKTIGQNLQKEELKISNNSSNCNITEEKLDNNDIINNRGSQIKLDDENNIDVNMIVNNSNKNRIQRITSKKRTKNNHTYGFFKEHETTDCGLDFTKDLKCGCTGGADSGCKIF